MLLAIVTLSVGCNKMFDANYAKDLTNKPVTVTAGANINQAKTYTTPGEQKFENGQPVTQDGQNVMTRSSYAMNADGDCSTWDEDYVESEEGTRASVQVRVLRRYNYRTGKYTVTTTVSGGNTTTAIRLTLDDNQDIAINIFKEGNVDKVEITVSHTDDQGNVTQDNQIEWSLEDMDVTSPDPADPNASLINGTWHVQNTIVTARGATFNRPGLDAHSIAEWAKDLDIINEKDVEGTVGWKVKNVMIMDSSLSINFENDKSFSSTVSSLSNFTVQDFDQNSEIGKYFNGTGSFNLSGELCVLSINGSIKGDNGNSATPITITLTLSK